MAKVEELTRQLEELRGRQNGGGTGTGVGGGGGVSGGGSGGITSGHLPTPASAELEKLRRELMVRLYLVFPITIIKNENKNEKQKKKKKQHKKNRTKTFRSFDIHNKTHNRSIIISIST